MARRGFTVLFTVLGIAVFISIAGFALLYMLFGREPAVPSRSTLVLNVGGDLSEMEPADVVGYLRGGKRLTVRGVQNRRPAVFAWATLAEPISRPIGWAIVDGV